MSGFVRDHISLYVDIDVEFNSLSEDHQDLAPEDETHNVLSRKFLSFFGPTSSQTKQMRFWEGTG